MAWKFRRWRIKWNPQKRRFYRKRRDRKKSREAYMRYRKNRGKMRQALRKSRIKGRVTRRKNKAKGIYRKLKVARKRWKNMIKSDVNNLEMYLNVITEAEEPETPQIEIDYEDIEDIKYALREIKRNVDIESEEHEDIDMTQAEFKETIDDMIKHLGSFKEFESLEEEDEDFLEEVISFIEEYAEEAGLIPPEDRTADEIEDDEEDEE